MSKELRWGIVSAGNISAQFVLDLLVLQQHPQGPHKIHHVIGGVGASSKEKAERFIKEKIGGNETKAHDYDSLIASDLDVLYVGLPHTMHFPFVMKAIALGKNILCEKPVTINTQELKKILEAAKKHNVFFMEAMWTRFMPALKDLQHRIYGEEQVIGEVSRVWSNFSYDMNEFSPTPQHRIVNKKLGGGSLLDIGIYPLTYARMFLAPCEDPLKDWDIVSSLTLDSLTGNTDDEVDFVCSSIISNKNKQQAIITSSVVTPHDGRLLVIEGSKGKISIESDNPSPAHYKIDFYDGRPSVFHDDVSTMYGASGFFYEAVEVGECIFRGQRESGTMSWNESLVIMLLLDNIRLPHLKYEQD